MSDAPTSLAATQGDDQDETEVTTPETDADVPQADTEPDTFPRDYVNKLRRENRTYRDRAEAADQRADELAQRLHSELVKSSGKLADATDLAFDAAHLDDADKLGAAIDALIESKPHLKSRRVSGDAGQGVKSAEDEPVSLLKIMNGQR